MINIKQDKYYKNFLISKPNLSEFSKKAYTQALKNLTKATQKTLTEIIESCKNQQDTVTEQIINNENNTTVKRVTYFDVNDPNSLIKLYLELFITYSLHIAKNTNRSTNQNMLLIKTFLKYYEIKLPKIQMLPDDTSEWYLLEKEDFKFVMSDSSLTHAALIDFLRVTGMRLADALNRTIGELMEGTSDYHDYVNVDEFIDNAPNDMICTWNFYPQKTKRHKIPCITFSDPDNVNRLIQLLKKIKNEYLPRINKEKGLNLTLSKSDALFGSRNDHYKGKIIPKSISTKFWEKNKKLRAWRIQEIDNLIKDGVISADDREREIEKIPRFHAHACRKFFQTMIARNCGDLRICTLLEGHVSPVKTDSSYIKISVSEVKEAYMAAIPDLSLENTETKVYTSEIRREMEAKIKELESKNQKMESELSEIDSMKERILALEKSRPTWNEFIKED